MSTHISISQPDWLDTQAYPFESKYFNIGEHRMHYVDEGEGPVVLFVHGTPTWSFLYRHQIKVLSKQFRCIAIDHLGFGLSDKPQNGDYHPKTLADNLERFIQALDLPKFTLVVHDFGGPIGLNYAIKYPDQIKSIVLFNSWMWATAEDKDAQRAGRIVGSFFGKWIYTRTNFSPKILLKLGFYDKQKLSKNIHKHYFKPFRSSNDRFGLLQIAQSLLGASGWYQELFDQRSKISHIPVLKLWGNRDPFIPVRHKDPWNKVFLNRIEHEFEAGHFVQEELPEAINALILDFLCP